MDTDTGNMVLLRTVMTVVPYTYASMVVVPFFCPMKRTGGGPRISDYLRRWKFAVAICGPFQGVFFEALFTGRKPMGTRRGTGDRAELDRYKIPAWVRVQRE